MKHEKMTQSGNPGCVTEIVAAAAEALEICVFTFRDRETELEKERESGG